MSIADYEELIAQRKKHSRLFSGGLIGLGVSLAMAQDRGPTAGWSWLVWSVGIAVLTLWAYGEFRHYDLLVRFHLLPHEIRRGGE